MDWYNIYSYRWSNNFSCFYSIFLSCLDKCNINPKLRTVLTGVVMFVGFGMRGIAMVINNGLIFIVLMIVRTFILFLSISISCLNSEIFWKYGLS